MDGEWQPIETAKPVEFIDVVLLARDHGASSARAMPAVWDGENWRALTIAGTMIYRDPTHWQPLPPPPMNTTPVPAEGV